MMEKETYFYINFNVFIYYAILMMLLVFETNYINVFIRLLEVVICC